jgi:hypothetical protein
MTTPHDFGGVLGIWDGLWTFSFGVSQFHGHGSWLLCEVVPNIVFSVTNSIGLLNTKL